MTNGEYYWRVRKELITEEEIKTGIKNLAFYLGSLDTQPLLLVGILKGSFVFLADLIRELGVPCEVDFMEVKSYYNDTKSSGKISITKDLKKDIKDYHVVIVEDIIDTGRTINHVKRVLNSRNPKSIRVVTLLDKPSRREVDIKPDKSIFTIGDVFVVGYGLDYDEQYRNLPYIAELDSSAL